MNIMYSNSFAETDQAYIMLVIHYNHSFKLKTVLKNNVSFIFIFINLLILMHERGLNFFNR